MALFNMTNRTGTADIKAFTVSATGYDCTSDPATTDFTLVLYHMGAGALPVLGDVIYKNSVATDLYTSADELNDKQILIDSSHLKVNTLGERITTC